MKDNKEAREEISKWLSVRDHTLPLETPILLQHKYGIEAVMFRNAEWRYWYTGQRVDVHVLQTAISFMVALKQDIEQYTPSPNSVEDMAKDYADDQFPDPRVRNASEYSYCIRDFIAGFLAASNKESEGDEWISVKDERKPDHKELVLAYGIFLAFGRSHTTYKARFYKGDEYNKECFVCQSHELTEVTHWRPLPEPPK